MLALSNMSAMLYVIVTHQVCHLLLSNILAVSHVSDVTCYPVTDSISFRHVSDVMLLCHRCCQFHTLEMSHVAVSHILAVSHMSVMLCLTVSEMLVLSDMSVMSHLTVSQMFAISHVRDVLLLCHIY